MSNYDYTARDKDGRIYLFSGRPHRGTFMWLEDNDNDENAPEPIRMPDTFMSDLRWEDEPIEIEIIAKRG